MKNLKRIFSLALVGTMLAGMLTIGASAANFTDAEDIVKTDAVNFMVALNIINGNDDGSFAPERTVSRAEMAKMITIALNGGREPVLGTKTTPTFSDIKGNWAEKYIEYCANLGIIGGRGNGTFDPNGIVTGTEAAKMVLVAMGYNSTIHNFTGADWALNVNQAANSATPNSLYKGLETIDPNEGLSRENAAQLIYNGVQDDMMKRDDSITVDDGKVSYGYSKWENHSILTEKYGYNVAYGFVGNVQYIEDDDAYDVTITNGRGVDGDGKVTYTKQFNASVDNSKVRLDATVSFKDDVSALYGQQVKVVYNDDREAVGIYAVDSKILATTTVGKLSSEMKPDATSIKVDGTTYRFDGTNKEASEVLAYNFLAGAITGGNLTTLNAKVNAKSVKEYAVDLIDNDGNGRINCVVVHPVYAAKITYLGKESITLSDGQGSYKLENEINIYEDAKKGDYVLLTKKANTADDKTAIVKAEIVTGTVGAVRATDSTEIRVDGTWYTPIATPLADNKTPAIGSDVDLVMVNGYYASADATKSTSKDLLVVTELGSKQDFDKTVSAKVALTDGTTDTALIKLATGSSKSEAHKALTLFRTDNTIYDGTKTGQDADDPDKCVLNKLFTYEKEGNTYTLTLADPANTGYDKKVPAGTFNSKTDKLGTSYVSDDAVVIVLLKNGAVKIITGAAVKSWSDDNYTVKTGFADTTNGLDYAQVLVVDYTSSEDLPGASGSTKYGYVVAKSYQAQEGKTTYTYFDLWNGTETVTVKEKQTDNTYAAGAIIAYEDLGSDEVKVKDTKFDMGAVTGYNDGKDKAIKILVGDGKEYTYTIDKDSKIFNIRTSDTEGVEGGSIELSPALNEGETKFNPNVYFTVDGKDKDHVAAIFVDVNGKINGKDSFTKK